MQSTNPSRAVQEQIDVAELNIHGSVFTCQPNSWQQSALAILSEQRPKKTRKGEYAKQFQLQSNIYSLILSTLWTRITAEWLVPLELQGLTYRIYSLPDCLQIPPVLLDELQPNLLGTSYRHNKCQPRLDFVTPFLLRPIPRFLVLLQHYVMDQKEIRNKSVTSYTFTNINKTINVISLLPSKPRILTLSYDIPIKLLHCWMDGDSIWQISL